MEPSFPLQKNGVCPQFSAHFYCGRSQTAGCIRIPLGTEAGRSPGNVVLDGDQAPPKRGTASQFSARVYCRPTAGWMKMPLGTEVDLNPGHIGLTETQLPPAVPPVFCAHVCCGMVAYLSYCCMGSCSTTSPCLLMVLMFFLFTALPEDCMQAFYTSKLPLIAP